MKPAPPPPTAPPRRYTPGANPLESSAATVISGRTRRLADAGPFGLKRLSVQPLTGTKRHRRDVHPHPVHEPGIPGLAGLIGAAGGRLGAPVAVDSPDGLAYGAGSVWAVDSTGGALSRINPATHAIVDQIPVGSAPSGHRHRRRRVGRQHRRRDSVPDQRRGWQGRADDPGSATTRSPSPAGPAACGWPTRAMTP
jgi:hypothetical protein